MSSPPGTPKQKKGFRRLLKEPFIRSRSRSPSQSQSPAVTPDEGAGSAASPSSVGVSPVDNAATGARVVASNVASSEGGIPSSTPIIVEPNQTGLSVTQSGATTEAPTSHTPASGSATAISGSTSPANSASAQSQKSRNVAWDGLRGSLRVLKNAASLFPPLSSAVGSVIACLDDFEAAAQNCEDFEDLANQLAALSNTLNQHMGGSSALTSGSVASIAISIKQQVTEVRERLDRVERGGIRDVRVDEEELVRRYRRIQGLFQQLQTNVSMSTWSLANEHLVNTRLEGLYPVKQAAYDSSLSTEINRRGCTEGTRTGVLASLDDWLYDPTSWSIYWMNGMAGTGKTTIASTFCERVENRKLLAASFFCTRSSAECKSITRIVPTIAYQLARYSVAYQSVLCKILGQNPDIGTKNVVKQFEQLLKDPLQRVKDAMPDHLVVVIDALDECEDRDGVGLILDMLFQYAPQVPLKFLVTSRPEPEIYTKMTTYADSREVLHLHEIEKSLVRADIELYLKEELSVASPSPAEIEQLVERSGTLFIYAATLVRYIRFGKRLPDPAKRLRSALSLTPEATKTHTYIDALYTAVLKSALSEDDMDADEAEDIRAVLRTVLFAQEPISVDTIATLAGIDDPKRVVTALLPLRSVLHQSDKTGLVSTLHASFPDFIFSSERSGSYFCDIVEHSELLAQRCFGVMKEQLRFNICNLETSFVPDAQVEGIESRINKRISSSLAYACRYWAVHSLLAPRSDTLMSTLEEFLCDRLLFWMEVMNLRREMVAGIDGMLQVQKWLMESEPRPSKLMLLVEDARHFVAGYAANSVSQSTPHIYISLLSFCPQSNSVRKHYWHRTRGLIRLKGSAMECRELAPLAAWRLDTRLHAVDYSPDGNRVVVGDRDGSIHILNVHDGSLLVGPFRDHSSGVTSVQFSPDGQFVASCGGSRDYTVRVWNSYNGVLVSDPFQGHTGDVTSIAYSPDGARLVSGSYDHTIRVWNVTNSTTVIGPLTGHTDMVLAVAFSPQNNLIASCSIDKTIRLWNCHDGTCTIAPLRGHTERVTCVAFTPDGTRVISGSYDKTLRVWNTVDGSLVGGPFEDGLSQVSAVVVSPDGTRVASESYGYLRVQNIDDGTLVSGPFLIYGHGANSIAYSPDGTHIISVSTDMDRIACVWNVRDGTILPPAPSSQSAVLGIKSVGFSEDGSRILTYSTDNLLRIWDPSDEYGSFITGPDLGNFQVPSPSSSPFSPNQRFVTGISEFGDLQIYNAVDGSVVPGTGRHKVSGFRFRFSRDNTSIILGRMRDDSIYFQPLQAGQSVPCPFLGHTARIDLIDQSLDCARLVSYSSRDRTLRTWDMLAPLVELDSHPDSDIGDINSAAIEGWHVAEDGWVMNDKKQLLLWLPADLAAIWKSPYASLIIAKSGTLQIPKQKLLVGGRWSECYVHD